MLRIRILLAASSLALVGLAAIALHLHSELTELQRALQAERSGSAQAASHPKGEQRRLAKLDLVDWNVATSGSGCVRVPLEAVDVLLPLNTKVCNGHACPPCFTLNATPFLARPKVTFAGCSSMYVGTQQLGSGSFAGALQQLEFINFNTVSSVAVSDGVRDFLIPPGASVWGVCLADGTNEIHLDASLRTYLRPGSEFQLVTSAPAWDGRSDHGAVVRQDGAVLVLGGHTATGPKNDVWSSADGGTTWARLVASASWDPRTGHQVLVRADGAVLVLGGQSAPSMNFNDVWCSVDGGSTWTMLTSSPSWDARWLFGAAARSDGSVLVMGGFHGTGFGSDVHSSADGGTTWILLTSYAWKPRMQFGVAVRSDDTVLVMGGFTLSGAANDVHASTDGIAWTQLTSAASWSVRNAFATVRRGDGALLVLGGYDGSQALSDAWSSTDGGFTWVQLGSALSWDPRQGHAVVVRSDGTLLLLGGVESDTLLKFGDVYKSEA